MTSHGPFMTACRSCSGVGTMTLGSPERLARNSYGPRRMTFCACGRSRNESMCRAGETMTRAWLSLLRIMRLKFSARQGALRRQRIKITGVAGPNAYFANLNFYPLCDTEQDNTTRFSRSHLALTRRACSSAATRVAKSSIAASVKADKPRHIRILSSALRIS